MPFPSNSATFITSKSQTSPGPFLQILMKSKQNSLPSFLSLFFFSLPCETCIMLPLSSSWPDQALFRQTANQNRNTQQVQEAVQPFLAASWKLCGRTATDAKTGCLSAFHFNPFLTTFRLDRCSRVTHRDFVADARVANQGSWQSHTVTAHVEVAHKTHLEIRLG